MDKEKAKVMKRERTYKHIVTYGFVILAIVIVAIVVYNMDWTEEIAEESYIYGNIEEWDYTLYCTDFNGISVDCKDYDNTTMIIKRKLYGDSFCNISCQDLNYTFNLTPEIDVLISAYMIIFTNMNETYMNCSYKCYGIFMAMG